MEPSVDERVATSPDMVNVIPAQAQALATPFASPLAQAAPKWLIPWEIASNLPSIIEHGVVSPMHGGGLQVNFECSSSVEISL